MLLRQAGSSARHSLQERLAPSAQNTANARSRPLTRSRSCGALGSHSTQLARLPDKVTGCAEAQGASSISRSAADSDAAGRLPLLSLSRCSRASLGTGMLKMETSPLPCATARSPSLQRTQSDGFTHTHCAATNGRVSQHLRKCTHQVLKPTKRLTTRDLLGLVGSCQRGLCLLSVRGISA